MGLLREAARGVVRRLSPQSEEEERRKMRDLKRRVASRDKNRIAYLEALHDLRRGDE